MGRRGLGRRYDGWLAGKKASAGRSRPFPPIRGGPTKGRLSRRKVSISRANTFCRNGQAGNGKQYTHVLGVANGRYVGSLVPGPEVGGNAGWQDMPYAIQALGAKNGEYLVLVEEDWRGKNLLYRSPRSQLGGACEINTFPYIAGPGWRF